jgi:hypothetical protein
MKKISALFTAIIVGSNLNAQEISYSEARTTALEFFSNINKNTLTLKSAITPQIDSFATFFIGADKIKLSKGIDIPALYIFNRVDVPGFVFVSAENRSKKILAYSVVNNITRIPPALNNLIAQYTKEILLLKELNCQVITEPSKSETGVGPLLENIRWNQSPTPYNTLCPNNTPAGCGAIAMAQILYYYKYPRFGIGSHTYKSQYRTESADFGNTEYKYELMEDSPEADASNIQISTLTYHCGVSVNMNYANISLSTIPDITNALSKYFGYKSAETKDGTFINSSSWENLIKNELDLSRPIIYLANDLFKLTTHIFIIDGYYEDKYFINWGWSGCSNGLYSLTALTPHDCMKDYNFNNYHEMTIGIFPSNPDLIPPQVASCIYSQDLSSNISIKFNEPINENTLINGNILINGSKSGNVAYKMNYDKSQKILTIDPDMDFQPQEKVSLTLTTGIKDLVGNSLDGDNNGAAGPNYTFSYTTGGYVHDYVVTSLTASNMAPIVGDNIQITATIKNVGQITEAANQSVYLYDNGKKVNTYSYFSSLVKGAEKTQSFNWTATAGAHELKVEVSLAGDENPDNNSKSISISVGTAGNLLINGAQSPSLDFALNESKYIDQILQLQNIGSASISGNVNKNGTAASWITLTDGSSFSLIAGQTIPYSLRISVPSGTAASTYTAYLVFSYEGGTKTITVQLNINVLELGKSPFPFDFNSGSVLIDGRPQMSTILSHTFNGSNSFYLDNDAATADPSSVTPVNYNMSITDYNRMYSATWTTNITEFKQSSSTSAVRISITENSSKSNDFYSSLNGYTDIMSWIVRGPNTFNLGLDKCIANAANVQWFVSSSSPGFNFTYAGWGKDCPIPPTTLSEIKAGWDKGRIYFKVDAVTTGGTLKLYNNGTLVTSTSISSYDVGSTKYFSLTSSKTSTSNYFVIIGDPTTSTIATLSNIRLELSYFTGDPNLVCTKSLSKNKIYINEPVDVTMVFNNIGSNIANNTSYDDNQLPSGLTPVSGNLSATQTDIYPATTSSPVIYSIQAVKPGIYNFGSSLVHYENQSRSKSYQTSFNSVSLQVMGGSLLVSGNVYPAEVITGKPVNISANITSSLSNSTDTDILVTCSIKNISKSISYPSFYLIFNPDSGKYLGEFNETGDDGTYEIRINAQKPNYDPGDLISPIDFNVNIAPFISVSPLSQSAGYLSGTVNYQVNTNVDWQISENEDWFTCTKLNNTTLQVNYDDNYSQSNRSGTVILTSPSISSSVTLSQENCYVTLINPTLHLSSNDTTIQVSLISNSSWNSQKSEDWLSISKGSGTGNGSFSINISKNTAYTSRNASVTINGCYGNISLIIEQDAAPNTTPTVLTNTISEISQTSAVIGGIVLSDGGLAISARGVCWNISGTPTTEDSVIINDIATGDFNCTIENLSPGTTYHVRAFATNSLGTVYGGDSIFITGKYAQSISFEPVESKTYGDPDFAIITNSSSGLPVSLFSESETIAKVIDGIIHIVEAGNCNIIASQSGNRSYLMAGNVTILIKINKASLQASVVDTSRQTGEPNPLFRIHYSGFVNAENESVLDTLPVTTTSANAASTKGNYDIILSGGADNNYQFTYNPGILSIYEPTGIENSRLNQFLVYPNPFHTEIFLKLNNNDIDYAVIEIADLYGRVILNKTIYGIYKKEKESINLMNLPNGLYTLKVTSKNWIKIVKLLKE